MSDKNIKRKRINPYLYGRNNYYSLGSFMNNLAGNPVDGKLTTGAFKGMSTGLSLGLSSIGTAVGQVGGKLIGGGLQSGAGNVLSGLSSIASAIPGPLGTVVTAGLGVVGGLTNRMFGSKLNSENIANIEAANAGMNSLQVDDSSNTSVADAFGTTNLGFDFNKKYVGKDGWFSNKVAKEYTRLLAERLGALNRAYAALGNAALNADTSMDLNILANFTAYGGPLFSYGGPIHINPENRGKFNATKRRTGKTTEELTHSSNPLTRKRAIFAQNAAKWKHAFGGELNTNGADFTNGLIFIDNGGSHESNPYEGVPMGVDQEGVPNLVEEGEVVFNDYVFSNRLKVPMAIRKKYKLGNGEPLTFADAIKKLSKESEERPNDPISLKGLKDSIMILMLAQEQLRQSKLERQYANGGNLFWPGGPMDNGFVDMANLMGWVDETFHPELLYKNTKSKSKAKYDYDWYVRKAKMLGMKEDDLSDFKKGFTEVDADNLAAFNLLARTWKNNKGKHDWDSTQRLSRFNADIDNKVIRKATGDSNNYFKGLSYSNAGDGYRKKDWVYDPNDANYGLITKEDFEKKSKEEQALYLPVSWGAGDAISDSRGRVYDTNNPYTADEIKAGYNIGEYKSLNDDWTDILFPENGKYNLLTALRYAPAVGAGIGAFTDLMGWTNKPDYTSIDDITNASSLLSNLEISYTPLGDYMAYTPFDKDYYINLLNAQAGATRRGITNVSGGNRGAAMAGLLSADYNYLNSLGALARQAEEYNLALREKALNFNRATNLYNSEALMKADMANQSIRSNNNELAYKGTLAAANLRLTIDAQSSAARSANLTNLFNSLGNIGREEVMESWINEHPALLYNISTKGNGVTYDGSHSDGGYLTVKKRRKR